MTIKFKDMKIENEMYMENEAGEKFILSTTKNNIDEFLDNINFGGSLKFISEKPIFTNPIRIEITGDDDDVAIGYLTHEHNEHPNQHDNQI